MHYPHQIENQSLADVFSGGFFCLFYNWPLTIRRRVAKRLEKRQNIDARYIHIPVLVAIGTAIFVHADRLSLNCSQNLMGLKDLWYLTFFVPAIAGALLTIFAGGLGLGKRIGRLRYVS